MLCFFVNFILYFEVNQVNSASLFFSEKSWILERKKPPKPKPKTYKGHKQQKLYNSQTESSEEDEPDDRSMVNLHLV